MCESRTAVNEPISAIQEFRRAGQLAQHIFQANVQALEVLTTRAYIRIPLATIQLKSSGGVAMLRGLCG